MEESCQVLCPYCGQCFELWVDTLQPEQRLTTDCEVCCRPLDLVIRCEPGEVLSVDVCEV